MNGTQSSYNCVLFVDDDPISRYIAETGFAAANIARIHIAADGHEALEILSRETDIALILCDLNMPNMDGLQFLRHLAERGFQGDFGIVSGENQSIIRSAEIMATKHGLKFKGTISKPLDIDKINELLSNAGPLQKTANLDACDRFSRSDLVYALVNRDIKAHFQPKISTRSGQLVGAEALARWDHPDMGFIPPAAFIPVAENDGLIQVVTAAILRDSLAALAHWSAWFPAMKMAVNLSGAVLVDPDLPEQLVASCRKNGVDPSQIILEITESRVLSDNAMPLEVLARLRMKRFELSVDDFGTGYSNIDRLREFPFTELKIDQSFIRNAGTDPFADKCVRASVDLGRALGLRLVAEGVETEDDYRLVKSLDIDLIQGHYFSKALAYDEFVQKYFPQSANVA